jgi:Sulfotransferase family
MKAASNLNSLRERGFPLSSPSLAPQQDVQASRPIFIFGQARSGTTLLQRLINSTNVALVYGEHLGILAGIAESYFEFFGHSELKRFCAAIADPEYRARTLRDLRNPKFFCAGSNGFGADHVAGAYRSFLLTLINPFNAGPRWGFKEVRYCAGRDFVVPLLISLFPKSQFVFTIRAPFAQVGSVLTTGWWKYSPEEAANRWVEQARAMLQYCREFPKNSVLARYEDLVQPDERAIRELFSWLDLPYLKEQSSILLRLGKVGATPKPRRTLEELREAVLQRCAFPDALALYP